MGFRSMLSQAFVPDYGQRLETKGNFAVGGDVQPMSGSMSPFGARWPMILPSTRIDYVTEAGDLMQSAIVMACIQWVCRTFPEAPLRVRTVGETDEAQTISNHPLIQKIRRPNEFYSGLLLMQATLLSYNIDGNAYWIKVRHGHATDGLVDELWYEPHTTCRPVWPDDGSVFISGYQVLRRGRWSEVIPRENVVHFRNGIDPANPRKGLAPLASALREVFTDNEAANFSASLLRNMGVPGVVVSPAVPEYTIDDPEGLKNSLYQKFSGDRRGEPAVMAGPTKMEVISWSPEQLSLEALRNIPEERISALLGVPAIVAGLGAGLDSGRFANATEARAAAYDANILPTQRIIAEELQTSLLPDFGDPDTEQVEFDLSRVQALSEDQDALFTRVTAVWTGGIVKRGEARTMLAQNLSSGPDDDVYFTDLPKGTEQIRVTAATPIDRLGDPAEGDPDESRGEDAGSVPAEEKSSPSPPTVEEQMAESQIASAFSAYLDAVLIRDA